MTRTFTDLLNQLSDVKQEGRSYLARCPSHPDGRPSLLLTLEPSGRLLLYCRAGCPTERVVKDLGLRMADLFNMKPGDATVATVGPKLAPTTDHLTLIAEYCEQANAQYRGSPAADYALRRFGIGADLGYFVGLGYDPGDIEFEYLTPPYHRVARLVVPFADFDGVIGGLQGRALEEDLVRWCGPRNPEGHSWSTLGVTDLETDERNFLVCEGPGDRLTAVGAGYPAVGIRGAALARNTDLRDTLSDHLVDRRIILCGDADESGVDFNLTLGHHLATAGHQVHTLAIAEGSDLTDWREADPVRFPDELRRALRAATRIDANAPVPEPPDDDDDDPDDWGGDPTPGDFLPHTDEGNAMRLLAVTGGLARWSPELGWVLYEEGAWVPDDLRQIQNAMSIVCQLIRIEGQNFIDQGEAAGDIPMAEHGMRLQAWGRRSENSPRFEQGVRHAEAKAAVPFDLFDQRDHLLVCANKTVDLRTGEALDHDPDYWMTHRIAHDYDPEATAPRWKQFLLEIFDGNTDVIDFVQRLVGYGITGLVREQCFGVLWGRGANGKSVFLGALTDVLEPIVGTAAFSAFEVKQSGSSTTDLASLRGKRMVVAQEGERAKPMAEAIIKRVTGGDRVTARHLYKEQMTFLPKFLLLMASNHKPRFGGQDEGLWRRVKMVPFDRYFAPDERDPHLPDKLRAEAVGILAWCVEGAIEYYRTEGLGEPPSVREATVDYQETSDDLAGFVGWIVVADPPASIKASDLYEQYRDWAIREGVHPWSAKALYEAVVERMPTVTKKKRRDGLHLLGVRLATDADRGDASDGDAPHLQTSSNDSSSSLLGEVVKRGSVTSQPSPPDGGDR